MSLTIKDFQIGIKFKVKVSHHQNNTYTVNQIHDGMIYCSDQKGHYHYHGFDDDNLKYYGNKVEIIGDKNESNMEMA